MMLKPDTSWRLVWLFLGRLGLIYCLGSLLADPRHPNPAEVLVFLTVWLMSVRRPQALLVKIAPFAVVILAYESLRSMAASLATHANFNWAPHVDRKLFGDLPTLRLQDWLWHGTVRWFDYA